MATTVYDDIRLEDIDVDDVDFSDLEAQYSLDDAINFDSFVVVDGAPVAPEAKVPALTKVLTKLFSQAGAVVNMEIPVEDGKTKGHLFIEFENGSAAKKAIKLFNGKKLDIKHRLLVNSLNDVERYGQPDFNVTFREPVIPEFESTGYLRSWLQDPKGRDQFVMQKGDMTAVFWNMNKQQPQKVGESRRQWSDCQVEFSPHGTYMFSFHERGIISWGGANFERLKKFAHPYVSMISISPTEKYLVTFSEKKLAIPETPVPDCPFGPESQGHQICVWDIATGVCVKTFALPPTNISWPLVKWSFDDKYCARLGPNAIAIYETENNFQLLEGKPMKIDNVQDFSFAPKGVKLSSNRASDKLSTVMCYWTPESNNQSCKAVIMEIPTRRILRTINLVQVSGVTFHWQNAAEYLCVQVDRHTKSKKTIFSNLEICRLNANEIPYEKIELKDRCMVFGWEPNGDRFATISHTETINDNPAIPKNVVTFYAPEKRDKKDNDLIDFKKWKVVKAIDSKFSNVITWSPAGRFVCLAALGKSNSRHENLDFYDLDYPSDKIINSNMDVHATLRDVAHINYTNATDYQWDPSGRYITFWSSALKHKVENGYKMFNLCGKQIREEAIGEFNNFVWRPRPENLLSNSEKKKVRKNLKEWSAHFDEQDAMEADSATRQLILQRRTWLQEWSEYRSKVAKTLEMENVVLIDYVELSTKDSECETIEEIKEQIVEETTEEVDTFEY